MYHKGDIILPINKIERKNWLDGLYHAAVIWDEKFEGGNNFQGIVLTSKGHYDSNILMQRDHFHPEYEFQFQNSHFIDRPFLKFPDWGPFKKVGQITHEGIRFIESHVANKDPEVFIDWHAGC